VSIYLLSQLNSVCLCYSILQLLLSLVFQLVFMRHLEKLLGSLRICIIYVVCGIAGSLSSAIFIPYHVEVSSCTAVIFGSIKYIILHVSLVRAF